MPRLLEARTFSSGAARGCRLSVVQAPSGTVVTVNYGDLRHPGTTEENQRLHTRLRPVCH